MGGRSRERTVQRERILKIFVEAEFSSCHNGATCCSPGLETKGLRLNVTDILRLPLFLHRIQPGFLQTANDPRGHAHLFFPPHPLFVIIFGIKNRDFHSGTRRQMNFIQPAWEFIFLSLSPPLLSFRLFFSTFFVSCNVNEKLWTVSRKITILSGQLVLTRFTGYRDSIVGIKCRQYRGFSGEFMWRSVTELTVARSKLVVLIFHVHFHEPVLFYGIPRDANIRKGTSGVHFVFTKH